MREAHPFAMATVDERPRCGWVGAWNALRAGAIALAIFAAGCATAPASDDYTLSRQVEAARTAAEHEALAQQYDDRAARARRQAEQHRALLASYEHGPQYRWIDRVGTPTGMRAMPRHCEQLIRNAEDDARIYTEMAEQHRQWAKQPPGADDELEER